MNASSLMILAALVSAIGYGVFRLGYRAGRDSMKPKPWQPR